jgi:hypothetical protein
MKLNENTMAVLTNFANIQKNLVLPQGSNVVRTIADAKNVMAFATLDQNFDKQVGIYDLSQFISVISLVDQPELSFGDSFMTVSDESGRSSVKFFYADEKILTNVPDKEISMPSVDVSFVLDAATLNKVRKASAALGHTKMTICPAGDSGVRLSVVYNTDETSNAFSIDVPGTCESGSDYMFVMNIDNMTLIPGDYEVEISQRLLTKFENKNVDVHYFIALEKSSTFGA